MALQFGRPAVTPTGGGGNGIMDFLSSPGGQALISGTLGGIGAIGQGRREERMNDQQIALQRAIMQQQGAQGMMNDSLTRDMALEQAAPLGWGQGYQQNQLLRNMLMQKIQNGPSGGAVPASIQGKLDQMGYKPFKPTIPEEWGSVNPFGVDHARGPIIKRQGILDKLSGGKAPALDFAHMGLPQEMADRYQQQTGDYRQFTADDYNVGQNRLLEAINMNRQGTNQQMPGQGGGPGIGSMIAGSAIPIGMAAMSMMGKGGAGGAGNVLKSVAGMGGRAGGGAAGAATSGLGMANAAAGPIGMGLGLASGFLPEGSARTAANWGAKGAQIGSIIPGVGTLAGLGIGAAAGAIKGHQNATIGDRKKLAENMGYANLDQLYQQLNTMGPSGELLREQGLNVIGKQDKVGNANWINQVQQLLKGQQLAQQGPAQPVNPYARFTTGGSRYNV